MGMPLQCLHCLFPVKELNHRNYNSLTELRTPNIHSRTLTSNCFFTASRTELDSPLKSPGLTPRLFWNFLYCFGTDHIGKLFYTCLQRNCLATSVTFITTMDSLLFSRGLGGRCLAAVAHKQQFFYCCLLERVSELLPGNAFIQSITL
jgi:hypothetical protein